MKNYEKDLCYHLLRNDRDYLEKTWLVYSDRYGQSLNLSAREMYCKFIKFEVSFLFKDVMDSVNNDMFLFYVHLKEHLDYKSMADFIIDFF